MNSENDSYAVWSDVNVTTTSSLSLWTNGAESTCNGTEMPLLDEAAWVNKIITPFIYTLGFPGNSISFLIWIRPKMRHSSGVYLAALALADFIFLVLHFMFELNTVWGVPLLSYPVLCEGFTIIFLTFQYLAPLLVLSFTVERYISICHPFKREQFCTTHRARIVSISLALGCLATCGIQGYFWTYTGDEDGCTLRATVIAGDSASLWSIWSYVTETLMFLVVPLSVLVFNILVIREAKRLSEYEETQLHGRSHKTSATTIMLLVVSFYLIITTLPATIVYATGPIFTPGKACDDPARKSYGIYLLIRSIAEEIGISHFALNFYIYMVTGKQFREEFKRLFGLKRTKPHPEKLGTEYTTLRSSFQGSLKKNLTVRMTSNGTESVNHKRQNGSESSV
ncbi:FMRFamide receptor-like [Dreissena polymorpha]|uniref:G-protein coupled receptors family 1 profile domain-containing protein n=1 Tax=Dreissena polymorpha TaxID=45954 RepID=A0A9D4KIL8_DREPO|nr:FMRFamide receptor-like [Dreissena polymorpha]XP_052283039.1 FMRFamide receptor-like [Dreissena polymorpha]XP_052283040.1 FMRFamide receptor-like [Dreissena polymorpha]XP_052283041.1 FMRFamide receptor-like [Dreissena polymorpha]KAH3840190.1 hypothetical protein DPMN_113635 [Dreissena polymorpha]